MGDQKGMSMLCPATLGVGGKIVHPQNGWIFILVSIYTNQKGYPQKNTP